MRHLFIGALLLLLFGKLALSETLNDWVHSNPVEFPGEIRQEAWWNKEQSGWGIFTFTFDNTIAAVWYTYDEDGKPTWFILNNLQKGPDGFYSGEVTKHTGVSYLAEKDAGKGISSQVFAASKVAYSVGPFDERPVQNTLDFAIQMADTNTDTVIGHKRVEFFDLGSSKIHCRLAQGTDRRAATNLSDIYWNPDRPGWGLQLLHFDDTLAGAWFTYDETGRATFFTMTLVETGNRQFEGEFYANNSGTPYTDIQSTVYNSSPAQAVSSDAVKVGDVYIIMYDGQSGEFRYVVNGVSYSQPITRFQSGNRSNYCEDSKMRGDYWAAEPQLKQRDDILYFGGYEAGGDDGYTWAETFGTKYIYAPENISRPENTPDSFQGKTLKVKHPANEYWGASFNLRFDRLGISDEHNKIHLRYYVKFSSGFDWVRGGKMPGLVANTLRSGCSLSDGTNGWSMRFMWRRAGRLVQYTYLPPQFGGTAECGIDIPLAVPRTPPLQPSPYTLVPDSWYCIEQAVTLNDADQRNGAIEVWVNNVKVLDLKNIIYRLVDNWDNKIGGVLFDSYMGGGDPSWQPNKDQYVMYDNFVIATNRIGCL
ncbi:MAG: hypothetical protein KatS3mg109_2065 [Pirellulaceae bacterium]|nr:MAG: hypothetical protein KatS3mg109_2065 [Pirellulaceae bacterium]